MVNDTFADLLTHIRNANLMKNATTSLPSFKLGVEIVKILKEEGFIKDYEVKEEEGKPFKTLVVTLKYDSRDNRILNGIQRISKPGLRITVPAEKLPRVRNGLGIAIISTSKGLMTDKTARKQNIGGEVLAYVW